MTTELVWMGDAPPSRDAADLAPGECVWCPGMAFWSPYEYQLSDHYEQHVRAVRRPIMIMCPTSVPGHAASFIIDSHPTSDRAGAWQVTVDLDSLVIGQRPRITVSPSIHLVGLYHGFLTAGVLGPHLG